MFTLTKKLFRYMRDTSRDEPTWAMVASLVITLAVSFSVFLNILPAKMLMEDRYVLAVMVGGLFWGSGYGPTEGLSLGHITLPLWLTFLPAILFTIAADLGVMILDGARRLGRNTLSWVQRKFMGRNARRTAMNFLCKGHNDKKIEKIILYGGPKQQITQALVNRAGLEFILDQLGRREFIEGPDGGEGFVVPEYTISDDGETATAKVVFRFVCDSQKHQNVKHDEVYIRYFILAFAIDRDRGTLETKVLKTGIDTSGIRVLEKTAMSVWEKEIDGMVTFDPLRKTHASEKGNSISATPTVTQIEGE